MIGSLIDLLTTRRENLRYWLDQQPINFELGLAQLHQESDEWAYYQYGRLDAINGVLRDLGILEPPRSANRRNKKSRPTEGSQHGP